jgi:Putative zinc-finger
MVVNCEEAWREISNYLDGELEAGRRAAMDEHFRGCKRCSSVLAGTRNVVELYGDERMVEVPLGFSYRLQRRLDENAHPSRRTFFGWMVAAAAAVLVAGSVGVARSSGVRRTLRSEHAQAGRGVPPDMMVLIYPDGKTFHVVGCPFILDKAHLTTVAAREAMREGYVPCTRCMKKYLNETATLGSLSSGA